jgi:hypothetical protein
MEYEYRGRKGSHMEEIQMERARLPKDLLTRRFTEEDIEEIKKYYWIDCEWLDKQEKFNGVGSRKCPTHGRIHYRLPDQLTFKLLVDLFPTYPMEAWAEVYKVSREAVRILYAQSVDSDRRNSYGEDREKTIYGEKPDWKRLGAYFRDVKEKLYIPNQYLLGYHDLTQSYVKYWMNRNKNVNSGYKKAHEVRTQKQNNPDEQKCYRCGEVKKINEFHHSAKTVTGYTKTCKFCSRASVKAYYIKHHENFNPENIPSEQKCRLCKQTKHRSKFHISRGTSTGLQSDCIKCMNEVQLRIQHGHKSRKKKFQEAGLDKNKVCLHCLKEKDYWNFYLLKYRPYSKNKAEFSSTYCIDCVKDARLTIPEIIRPTTTNFTSTYRASHKFVPAKYNDTNEDTLVEMSPYAWAEICKEHAMNNALNVSRTLIQMEQEEE